MGVLVVLLEARGDREDVGVEDDVLRREARLLREQAICAAADLDLAVGGVCLALLVERHHYGGRAVLPDASRQLEERGLALLEADRVHDALALQALEPRFYHLPLGGVDHHRDPSDVGLRRDQVEERAHRLSRVEQSLVHVHVEHLRAARNLLPRHLDGGLVVAGLDELGEAGGAGDVGALPDVHEQCVGPDHERFEPAQSGVGFDLGHLAWRVGCDRLDDGADVRRCRAAAPAHHVHEPAGREVRDDLRHLLGRLVVGSEFVGEPRIGVAAHPCVGHVRELLEIRTQLAGPNGAVEAHAEQVGVAHRDPERLGRLPRERASTQVGDRARDHHGQFETAPVQHLTDAEQGRLPVQRIEHRLDQEQVHAAVDQRFGLLRVRRGELVERHRAEARVVHVRRERRSTVGGPQAAGHEARLRKGAGGDLVRDAPGDAGGGQVHVAHRSGHPVVGLRDRAGIERVGLEDVGAGVQVRSVDRLDYIGTRDGEQIVVAP